MRRQKLSVFLRNALLCFIRLVTAENRHKAVNYIKILHRLSQSRKLPAVRGAETFESYKSKHPSPPGSRGVDVHAYLAVLSDPDFFMSSPSQSRMCHVYAKTYAAGLPGAATGSFGRKYRTSGEIRLHTGNERTADGKNGNEDSRNIGL